MNFPSIMLFCCLIFFLPNNSITSWFENHALYFEIYASVSVQLKTHPIEFTVTAKWGSPFSLGQSPEYTRRRALQLALPQASQEGTPCFCFSWARFPVISIWVAFLFAAHSAFRADTYSLSLLLIKEWRERGRKGGERERGRTTISPPPKDCNKGAYVSTKKIPWQQKLFNWTQSLQPTYVNSIPILGIYFEHREKRYESCPKIVFNRRGDAIWMPRYGSLSPANRDEKLQVIIAFPLPEQPRWVGSALGIKVWCDNLTLPWGFVTTGVWEMAGWRVREIDVSAQSTYFYPKRNWVSFSTSCGNLTYSVKL